MSDKEINDLLEKHASISQINEGKKLRCLLSGHEMPKTVEAIKTYVNGKKYKKFVDTCTYDYNEYKRFLIRPKKQHKKDMLLCELTLRHIANDWVHIDRHIKGKRFQRAYKRWQECEEKGEKFVPIGKKKPKMEDSARMEKAGPEFNEEEDEELQQADDDLTDLYPWMAEKQASTEEEEEAVGGRGLGGGLGSGLGGGLGGGLGSGAAAVHVEEEEKPRPSKRPKKEPKQKNGIKKKKQKVQ